jgi:hypothetical protein
VELVGERTIPTVRPPVVGELVPTFADRGCRVVSVTDPCKLVAVRGLGSVSRRTFGHRDSTYESTTRDHLQLAEWEDLAPI